MSDSSFNREVTGPAIAFLVQADGTGLSRYAIHVHELDKQRRSPPSRYGQELFHLLLIRHHAQAWDPFRDGGRGRSRQRDQGDP